LSSTAAPVDLLTKRANKVAPASEATTAGTRRTHARSISEEELQMTILLADDSKLCRKVVSEVIKRCGANWQNLKLKLVIVEADDGLPAIEIIKRSISEPPEPSAIDFVFMDNTMIKCHGTAATRECRRLGFVGSIYGLTGNTMQSDVDEFISSGASEVLCKPLTAGVMEDVLKKEIDIKLKLILL